MRNESKILCILERYSESGLTVKDFCSNEGIASATFYNWKKKLRDNNEKRFIPINVRNTPTLATGANINTGRQENNNQPSNVDISAILTPISEMLTPLRF